MVEPSVIRELLEEMRFDEAAGLIEQSSHDPDDELRREIARRRDEAEDRGRDLARHIVELGEERNLDEIVDLGRDATTAPLLALAPDTSRKRAELYLRESERWANRRAQISARRLGEARRALDGLDLELARGLMKRIDGRFLSDEQMIERDQLLLDISARAMEVESLTAMGRRLADETGSRERKQKKPPWWQRRR